MKKLLILALTISGISLNIVNARFFPQQGEEQPGIQSGMGSAMAMRNQNGMAQTGRQIGLSSYTSYQQPTQSYQPAQQQYQQSYQQQSYQPTQQQYQQSYMGGFNGMQNMQSQANTQMQNNQAQGVANLEALEGLSASGSTNNSSLLPTSQQLYGGSSNTNINNTSSSVTPNPPSGGSGNVNVNNVPNSGSSTRATGSTGSSSGGLSGLLNIVPGAGDFLTFLQESPVLQQVGQVLGS